MRDGHRVWAQGLAGGKIRARGWCRCWPHDVMPYAVAMTTWTGWSPTDALTAATARAGEAVGLGGQVGVLRPGAAADVLAVNRDPTVDVDALVDVVAV